MFQATTDVPAHIALLLNEKFSFTDIRKARKKIREMSRDLKDQVELIDVPVEREESRDPKRYKVVLSGGLDLFASTGACSQLPCRVGYAQQVARSIVLTADQVYLHDFFFDRITTLGRLKNEDVDSLIGDVLILKLLAPLIKEGIVAFLPTSFPTCLDCLERFDHKVEGVSEELIELYQSELAVTRHDDGHISIDCGPMYTPSIHLHFSQSASHLTDHEVRSRAVFECVRSALHDTMSASLTRGTVVSNSMVGLAGIRKVERFPQGAPNFRAMLDARAGDLPWVRGLTIEQTIQLRQEASTALPNLREFLARHLAARQPNDPLPATTDELFIAELREQAAEVRSELNRATSKRAPFVKNSLGIAGLGVAALGFANDPMSPASGIAALLSTLGMLRQLAGPHEEHAESMKAKPGYVLVAAEEILAHASK